MSDFDASLPIRRGHPDEAGALAKLHVAVWRATYADYAPADAIAALDEGRRLPYWTSALAVDDPGQGVWVVADGSDVLGVVSVGRPQHAAFEGRAEIKHLYVAGSLQGRGLGQRLLRTALDACKAARWPGVALAVVQQNAPARGFYRKIGGVEVGAFTDPGPLWRSENILVAWDDI